MGTILHRTQSIQMPDAKQTVLLEQYIDHLNANVQDDRQVTGLYMRVGNRFFFQDVGSKEGWGVCEGRAQVVQKIVKKAKSLKGCALFTRLGGDDGFVGVHQDREPSQYQENQSNGLQCEPLEQWLDEHDQGLQKAVPDGSAASKDQEPLDSQTVSYHIHIANAYDFDKQKSAATALGRTTYASALLATCLGLDVQGIISPVMVNMAESAWLHVRVSPVLLAQKLQKDPQLFQQIWEQLGVSLGQAGYSGCKKEFLFSKGKPGALCEKGWSPRHTVEYLTRPGAFVIEHGVFKAHQYAGKGTCTLDYEDQKHLNLDTVHSVQEAQIQQALWTFELLMSKAVSMGTQDPNMYGKTFNIPLGSWGTAQWVMVKEQGGQYVDAWHGVSEQDEYQECLAKMNQLFEQHVLEKSVAPDGLKKAKPRRM